MRKRLIMILFIVLLVLSLPACSFDRDVDEIKKRFESHTPDGNVVAVLDNSTFYFADHTLRLRDIADGEEPNDGYLFSNGKLYFSTTKENGIFDFSLYVYECDLYGNNKHLVFEKHGYKTHPRATGNQEMLYVEHYTTNALDTSARVIDSYNVFTGVYQTMATGNTAHLSDYKTDVKGIYLSAFEDGVLSIVDVQKNTTYIFDPVTTVSGAFDEELDGLDYSFCGFYAATNAKIFLVYRIESTGSQYPHLVCEYIPDVEQVGFSFLYLADDITTFYIEYL